MEKAKIVAYWVCTVLVVFFMLPGGIFMLMHAPQNVEGLAKLGYPAYYANILGLGKVLCAPALLAPKFPRLKEWAYAGVFFDTMSASYSHIATSDSTFHILAPLAVAAITLASWKLRPESRVLGKI